MSTGLARKKKDPNSVEDFVIDLKAYTNGRTTDPNADFLESGETISTIVSVTVYAGDTTTVDDTLTVDSSSITDTNTSITIFLSAGIEGRTYTVTARFTTSASRTFDKSFKVICEHT